MPTTTSSGCSISYDDLGAAAASPPILLLHGFASNRGENWRRVGWTGAFERRRCRVLAPDLRGHGESWKPHDAAQYTRGLLLDDIFAVLDAAAVPSAVVMGYSMGARLALAAALAKPERVSALVLGGIGGKLFDPPVAGFPMAAAMEATDPDAIAEPLLRSFRAFAEEEGQDLQALAAFARSAGEPFDATALAGLQMPVLVVAGGRDTLAGSPEALAEHIPGAQAVTLPGCDHFSAMAHALFKAAVFDFLDETIG
jgi:pimeloyl-ACP methyl ester carboxylesterase